MPDSYFDSKYFGRDIKCYCRKELFMSASSSTLAGRQSAGNSARPQSQPEKSQPEESQAGKSKPRLTIGAFFELLKQTYAEWNEDKAPRLGAAFSFYTISSLAPLLIVIITIAGIAFGEEAARGQIESEIRRAIGPEAARGIEDLIANAGQQKKTGIIASIAGIATLLLSASALFGQLQDSLNTIWEVTPKPGLGIWAMIRQRFLSFTMVLGVGFLMLVSLALSAAISAISTFFGNSFPIPEWTLQAINFVGSFIIITGLFAMMYKVLPDAEVQWRDVWVGAALTSVLFAIGKFALGLYLGKSGASSAYGAAGSLVLILLWIYYAAQILFFGAEFTQVYANRFGSKVEPSPHAVRVTGEMRAQQGMPSSADVQAATIASEFPGEVPSAQVWRQHAHQSTSNASGKASDKTAKGGHIGPVDSRDVEYLGAALAGLAATLFLFRRRK
jgi:membrane protein